MKLKPMADNVLLKTTEAAETTVGGIILPLPPRKSPLFMKLWLSAPAPRTWR